MKFVSQKTLLKGRFLAMNLITYRDHKGVLREWESVGRVNSNGVAVVIPVTDTNELVLIKQYRPAHDAYVIEPPAGLVDPGEDAITAAGRELVEETGYSSDSIVPLTEGVMSTGIDTENWSVFLAPNAKKVSEEIVKQNPRDENEDIEVITLPFENVYEILQEEISRGNKVDLRIFGFWELTRRKLNIV